jgi:hypothetical protein
MKELLKKCTALFLAAILLISVSIDALAADDKISKTPVVIVPGVTNTPVYDDEGNQLFWPDFKNNLDIDKTVKTLKDVMKLQDTHNYSKATDELLEVCRKLFDPAKCDADGNSIRKAHCIKANNSLAEDGFITNYNGEANVGKTIGDQIGMKNVYVFTYDWRLDIVNLVDTQLAPFIEKVKKETGSDKITLVGSSMGGAMTNTYLTRYGYRNDLKKVVFLSGAGQGVQFVNDVFCDDISISRAALAPYFKTLSGTAPAMGISAISGYFTKIAQNLMDSQVQKIWDEFLIPDLLCYPAMWELAKHTPQIDALLKSKKNKTFCDKIERYYAVQDNIKSTLTSLKKKGVEICYTSNYDLVGVPVTKNAMITNTDYLINTANTSNGATVASLFETLGDNYKQKNSDGHNHISSDGIIDASTCFSPETTWFIKDMIHVDFGYNTPQSKFIRWIVVHDGVNVRSSSKYPQFMQYDKNAKTLTPLTKVEIESAKNNDKGYISSAVTTYTYTQLTALGWAVIALAALAIIIIIAKASSNKDIIEGIMSKKEIKALPKAERKAAKHNNKALKKQFRKDKKSARKARKAELKTMPKAERKAAKKADKFHKKSVKKQNKIDRKSRKSTSKPKENTAQNL